MQPRFLGFLVVLLLVAVVLLCLSAFGIRRTMTPTLEDVDGTDNDKKWAKDLLQSCFANRAEHAFRVDQYRVASRYFTLALFCTLALALSYKGKDSVSDLIALLKRIEHNGLAIRSVSVDSIGDTVLVRVIQDSVPSSVAGQGQSEQGETSERLLQPQEEAERAREYYLEYLKLPVTVGVWETSFHFRDDGYRINDPSPLAPYYPAVLGYREMMTGILVDRTGKIRAGFPITQATETKIRNLIAELEQRSAGEARPRSGASR